MVQRRRERDAEAELNLPPGFRFHPTDEELVAHYLCARAAGRAPPVPIIAELDLYRFDPWELPGRALFGAREWYFFTPRDRKYPNGSRPNRAAGTGYWKATGADKPVAHAGRTVGIKKAPFFSGYFKYHFSKYHSQLQNNEKKLKIKKKNDITTEDLLLKTNLKVITTTGASHERYIAQNLENAQITI